MGKHQCQGTLHVSTCPNRASTWSPVASTGGTHSYLWGTTPWFLKGTSLSVQSEHPCHGCTTKMVIWQIVSANQVPLVVHPTRTATETKYPAQKGWVLKALDLQGLKEWPESEQKQARELLLKWEHLFAHSDLDLGKTALTKHKITLADQMPFKEHYRCISLIGMTMWGPISRKCWILVPSISCTVCGAAQ